MPLNDDHKDCLIGVGFLLFGAFVYYVVSGYPSASGAFPRLIVLAIFLPFGSLMILRGVLNIVRHKGVNRTTAGGGAEDMAVYFDGRTIVMSIAIIASIFGINYIGFLESMFVLAIVSCFVFGMKLLNSAIFVTVMMVAFYLFLYAMSIRMPRGYIVNLLNI
jgi:hypothetical protein